MLNYLYETYFKVSVNWKG